MDVNIANMRALFTGVTTAFNAQLAAVEPLWGHIAMEVGSTTAANQYPRIDDLPGFRKWVGDRVVHDLSGSDMTIVNEEYEKTIGVKRSQIEDDQYGFLAQVIGGWGTDAGHFPDELVYPLMKTGETALCHDGQYFFDTDHPGYNEQGNVTSVSNLTQGAAPAWYLVDDTQAVKPMIYQKRKAFVPTAMDAMTDSNVFHKARFEYGIDGRAAAGFGLWKLIHKSKAVLDETSYAAARTAMTTIRKRNGQIEAVRPRKLLVPPALEGVARKLLNADYVAGGDTNVWKGSAELVVVPHLA